MICTRCGKEFQGPGTRCKKCKDDMALYNKQRREALKAMGRCTVCGKGKPAEQGLYSAMPAKSMRGRR